MMKFIAGFAVLCLTCTHLCEAGPVEEAKSADDDMKTSETFGYGYYQPRVYSPPLAAAVGTYQAAPVAAYRSYPIAAPVATSTALLSSSAGDYSRSGYGYGSGYKYGGGYGYGDRWGYGTGNSVNEVHRRHPVYVAWG